MCSFVRLCLFCVYYVCIVICVFEFIASCFIVLLQNASPVAKMPATGFANFRLINAVPCDIKVKGAFLKGEASLSYQTVCFYFYSSLFILSYKWRKTLDNMKVFMKAVFKCFFTSDS